MNFRSFLSLLSNDLAIDLGTANTLVYARGKGIVVSEPSIVAMNMSTGTPEAFGKSAKDMVGRAPNNIQVGSQIIIPGPSQQHAFDEKIKPVRSAAGTAEVRRSLRIPDRRATRPWHRSACRRSRFHVVGRTPDGPVESVVNVHLIPYPKAVVPRTALARGRGGHAAVEPTRSAAAARPVYRLAQSGGDFPVPILLH